MYGDFLAANPEFLRRTPASVASHRNCYYPGECLLIDTYPGLRVVFAPADAARRSQAPEG